MLVEGQRPLSPDEALASWHELAGRVVPICAVLMVLAVGEGVFEWYVHSFVPLQHHSVEGLSPEYACSWVVAAALDPRNVPTLPNQLLSLLMFVGQGIAASFYLSLVAVVLAFAYWTDRFDRRAKLPDLLPALESTDRRRGFEQLEPFVQTLFLSALAFTASLFLIRLQFVFAGTEISATSPKAMNAYSFIVNDVAAGFFEGAKALFVAGEKRARLFDAGPKLVFSSATAIAGFLVLLMVSFLIVSTVLRWAAERARDTHWRRRKSCGPCTRSCPRSNRTSVSGRCCSGPSAIRVR